MVKLEIILDEPSIDLSIGSDSSSSRCPSVPLSGRLVLAADRPTQIKYISLKYDCINSHIDLEEDVYVYYNLHRSVKRIPPGSSNTLPAGVHQYPFKFLIPKNLPPSLKAPLGEVSHRLRASIKRPGHVPTLLYRIAKADGCVKVPVTVHNSNHVFPKHEHTTPARMRAPDDPPEYTSNRLEWVGSRPNGQIDWVVQGPVSAHISHRIDLLARLNIAKGYGVVSSATVDLLQIEKYQAEPDPNVWTYPAKREEFDQDDAISSSDDGFPEIRSRGITLNQGVSLVPLSGPNGHCREKRTLPVKSETKLFPPPPDPNPHTKGYAFHLAMSLPLLRTNGGLFPSHTSPLINISHRLRIRFTFSPTDTKELGIILPITLLPIPTPNIGNAYALAELNCGGSGDTDEFWMVLVEEEGESGPIPERARMNSSGSRGGHNGRRGELGLPPRYEDRNWSSRCQERRGSIPIGIAVQ